ncbi:MAG: adenylosuccinate lyase, partial [Arthrobacter pascens]|nr:adenylosuccinate lyase [Arthrobacter pascens]
MPETAATADTRTPSGRLALAASPEQIALGPLDGRYQSAVAPLVDYLSEAALNRDRVAVEVEWLIHLTSNNVLPGAGP